MVVLALLAGAAVAPVWSINENRTLIWNGTPYAPVGVRIEGTPEAIRAANEAGIENLIVELPPDGTGWEPALAALKQTGQNYFIALDGPLAPAICFVIEPEGYRVPGINGPFDLDIAIPGGEDALLVSARVRTGQVAMEERVLISDGRIQLRIDPGTDVESVLLIYPRMQDRSMPNYWEALDLRRDELLFALSHNDFGDGLRGIIGPLGRVPSFGLDSPTSVPDSQLFRMEHAAHLREKYGTPVIAVRAWRLGSYDLTTFEDLARLVPLWSRGRGVFQAWDPLTDRTYRVDDSNPVMWDDIRNAISAAALRRYSRLAANIRDVTGVPVLQTWNGWRGPYELGALDGPDGVGIVADGTSVIDLVENTARPASTVARASGSMALIATEVRIDAESQIGNIVRELESMGTRGVFFVSPSPEQINSIAELSRGSIGTRAVHEWSPDPVYYPQSARNPAAPTRLGGGHWWFPSPAAGNRIDYGSRIAGYRYVRDGEHIVVLWSVAAPQRVELLYDDTEGVEIVSLIGEPLEIERDDDELELILPTTPVVVSGSEDVPVPDVALAETVAQLDLLFAAHARRIDFAGDEEFLFRDAVKATEDAPSAAFLVLREQLRRLAPRAAPYIYAELEDAEQHNFGYIEETAGLSGHRALALNTRLAGDYSAVLQADVPIEGIYTAFVAMERPAPGVTVTLSIAGAVHSREGSPISHYGDGYAWYRFGNVQLSGESLPLTINVSAPNGASLRLDAVLLAGPGVVPRGPFPPLDWLTPR